MAKKYRSTSYGGEPGYVEDDAGRALHELVSPEGGRPSWEDSLGSPMVAEEWLRTPAEREAAARKAEAESLERSRSFEITKDMAEGRGKVFDEE